MLCFILCKYDLVEYEYFKELDLVLLMFDGMNDGEGGVGVGVD